MTSYGLCKAYHVLSLNFFSPLVSHHIAFEVPVFLSSSHRSVFTCSWVVLTINWILETSVFRSVISNLPYFKSSSLSTFFKPLCVFPFALNQWHHNPMIRWAGNPSVLMCSPSISTPRLCQRSMFFPFTTTNPDSGPSPFHPTSAMLSNYLLVFYHFW